MDLIEITQLVIDALHGADRRALAQTAGYDPELFEDLVECFLRAGITALLEAPKRREGVASVLPLFRVGERTAEGRIRPWRHGHNLASVVALPSSGCGAQSGMGHENSRSAPVGS